MGNELPLVVSFIIYLTMLLLIGIYFYSKNKNMSDYFIGGRGLGPFVTALSAGASDMSSWLLLGLPGMMYAQGLVSIWVCIGLIIGSFLNWKLIAYRLRVLTERIDNCITLPEFFSKRFEDDKHYSMLRIVSSFVVIIFFTLYVSAGFVGGAKLFEGSFDIPYSISLFVGGAVIIFYTFFGGYFAVSWTDVIQGLLVCLSLMVFPVIMIYEMGSFANVLNIIKEIHPEKLIFYGESISLITIVSSMSWGIGYFGQPHIVTRFMSISNEKHIKSSMYIGMTWMILTLLGSVLSAFVGIAYIDQNSENLLLQLEDPEHIIIFLNRVILNPWIGGIIISAILAAIMSTVDSQLLVSASSISNDLYTYFSKEDITDPKLKEKLEEKSLFISRIAVLVIAIIAILLALNPESKVLDLVSNAWAGFGSTFGPALLFSLFWKKTTARAILTGMIIGTITVIFWEYISPSELKDLYEIIPGFLLASFFIFAISLVDNKKVSKDITDKLSL